MPTQYILKSIKGSKIVILKNGVVNYVSKKGKRKYNINIHLNSALTMGNILSINLTRKAKNQFTYINKSTNRIYEIALFIVLQC